MVTHGNRLVVFSLEHMIHRPSFLFSEIVNYLTANSEASNLICVSVLQKEYDALWSPLSVHY